eukprot:scaffold4848_cov59-Phaeocystis_antarctica.AAC.4
MSKTPRRLVGKVPKLTELLSYGLRYGRTRHAHRPPFTRTRCSRGARRTGRSFGLPKGRKVQASLWEGRVQLSLLSFVSIDNCEITLSKP